MQIKLLISDSDIRRFFKKFGEGLKIALPAFCAQYAESYGACKVPPAGWHCTRAPGHEGPCAAVPTDGVIADAKRKAAKAANQPKPRGTDHGGFGKNG